MDVERPAGDVVVYLSSDEAAKALGCKPKTIVRAARAARCGVFVRGGTRFAAVSPADLPRLRPYVHETSGNPVWIAAGKAKATRARRRPAKAKRAARPA